MIQIEPGMIAIFVTILFALLGMAAAWGTLHEKVKNNCKQIIGNYNQNREDHQMLFNKLTEIQRDLKNSYKNHGG